MAARDDRPGPFFDESPWIIHHGPVRDLPSFCPGGLRGVGPRGETGRPRETLPARAAPQPGGLGGESWGLGEESVGPGGAALPRPPLSTHNLRCVYTPRGKCV